MTPPTVLFDLDGTLADTLHTIGRVVNRALVHLGLEAHPLERYRSMVGDGIRVLCERALPPSQAARFDEFLARVWHEYRLHRSDEAKLYDGILDVLDGLAVRGARLAVVSNKPDELTHGTLEDLGIHDRFQCVLGQRDDLARKPAPAGVDFVLARVGGDRSRTIFVGDTAVDVETALAAGVVPVGVTWGFRPRAELAAAGAVHLVETPRDLLPLYDRLYGVAAAR